MCTIRLIYGTAQALLVIAAGGQPTVGGADGHSGLAMCLAPDGMWGCHRLCDTEPVPHWIGYATGQEPCASTAEIIGTRPSTTTDPATPRGWGPGLLTISSSDFDPYVNHGPPFVAEDLHLWLVELGCGYGFYGIRIEVASDFYVDSYEPVAPGRHAWEPAPDTRGGTLLLTDFDCLGECYPYGDCRPHLIGTFSVSRLRVEAAPFESSSWADVKRRWRPSGTREDEPRR